MSVIYLGEYRYKNIKYTEEMRRKYPDHKLLVNHGASIDKPFFIHPVNAEKFEGKFGLKFHTHQEYKELRNG